MPENLVSEITFVMIGTGCQGWIVSGKSVNKLKGNSDHYLRDNRGFK